MDSGDRIIVLLIVLIFGDLASGATPSPSPSNLDADPCYGNATCTGCNPLVVDMRSEQGKPINRIVDTRGGKAISQNTIILCQCDGACGLFGDCCLSQNTSSCPEPSWLNDKIKRESQFMTCAYKIRNGVKLPQVLLVNRCPTGVNESLCSDEFSFNQPLVYQLPVYDRMSGMSYKNIFCALCHGTGVDSTVTFGVETSRSCEKFDYKKQMSLFLEPESTLQACGGQFSDPGPLLRPCMTYYKSLEDRRCSDSYRDSCNPDSPVDSDLREKCRKFTHPVILYKIVYKNKYCLKCRYTDSQVVGKCPTADCEIEGGEAEVGTEMPPATLSTPRGVVRDILGHRSLVDLILPRETCPPGETMDALTETCQPNALCRPGYERWTNGTNTTQCTMNPHDEDMFSQPVLEDEDGAIFFSEIRMKNAFLLVGSRDEENKMAADVGKSLSRLIAKNLRRYRGVNGRLLNSEIEADFSPSTTQVLGGVRFEIAANSLFKSKSLYSTTWTDIEKFLNYIILSGRSFTFESRNYHFSHNSTWTRNAKFPLRCGRGKLASLQIDKVVLNYLKNHAKKTQFRDILVELNLSKKALVIHYCDKLEPKFLNCRLIRSPLSEFSLDGADLIHNESESRIVNGNYVISSGHVFRCAVEYFDDPTLHYVSLVGIIISELFLLFTLIVYSLLPKLRTTPGKMIMNLSLSLFLAQLMYLLGLCGITGRFCELLAVGQHYFWLSTFFWMNAIAINTCRTFTPKMSISRGSFSDKDYKLYCVYAYGLALVIVIICSLVSALGGTVDPVYSGQTCWLHNKDVLKYAFIMPFSLMILSNIVLFIIAIVNITRIRKATLFAKDNERAKSTDVLIYIKLSALMGFSWIFGIVAVFWREVAILYLFVVFNVLTGVFMALSFACSRRVFTQLERRFTKIPEPGDASKTLSSHVTVSQSRENLTPEKLTPETKF